MRRLEALFDLVEAFISIVGVECMSSVFVNYEQHYEWMMEADSKVWSSLGAGNSSATKYSPSQSPYDVCGSSASCTNNVFPVPCVEDKNSGEML
jgi:hypothetical protein